MLAIRFLKYSSIIHQWHQWHQWHIKVFVMMLILAVRDPVPPILSGAQLATKRSRG